MESLVYTVSEVAKLLKCTETSVYNMRDKGTLHQLKGVAGVRFSKKEVESRGRKTTTGKQSFEKRN